jgi:hypothetical protein
VLDKEPISKLCDEPGLQSTVFYRWRKEFFENGAAASGQKARLNHSTEEPGGRLPAADIHNAGCRHRGGESVQCLAGSQPGGTVIVCHMP